MGLDISAYSKIEYLKPYDCDRFDTLRSELGDNVCDVTINGHYPERCADLKEGIYKVNGESMGFRAGSYSGYNAWRKWLSKAALGVDPEAVWANPEEYEGKPFFELICFSDCEGTMGTEVCSKLAKDFAEFMPPLPSEEEPAGWGNYNIERYEDWRKAFKLASDGGAVDFH